MAQLPLHLCAYRFVTAALEPAAPLALRRRARRGKENPERLRERLGYASRARAEGELIWIHGASVGECLAVLPLIDALLAVPGRTVLMTSGTVTSADMMAERLPARAIHQFAPVDTPRAVSRFLDHWRPAVGLFVDSEIWPNTLVIAHERGVRLAIVNGRMSEKSFAGWSNAKKTAAQLLSLYDIALAQDEETAKRLRILGAPSIEIAGSLKADALPLPADAQALAALKQSIGNRHIFLATNTHEGEDAPLLTVHDSLHRHFPDILTIIAPRHIERGADIALLCGARPKARRSLGQHIEPNTEVYIADTMGELGLFYRLATFAFVGKSLMPPGGGQNPLEPAKLGVAVISGPNTENFREAYEAIFAAQSLGRVASGEEIAALALRLFGDPEETKRIGEAATKAVLPLGGALERTRRAVEDILQANARA